MAIILLSHGFWRYLAKNTSQFFVSLPTVEYICGELFRCKRNYTYEIEEKAYHLLICSDEVEMLLLWLSIVHKWKT